MSALTVELSEEEYAYVLEMPREERDSRIAAVFATVPSTTIKEALSASCPAEPVVTNTGQDDKAGEDDAE